MTSVPYVLLVDDHAETLGGMEEIFSAAGFAVVAATGADQAVDAIGQSVPPGLIVTDLDMPYTSGWDFLKYLREDLVLRHVPVIVTTGRAVDSRTIADVILSKPIDPHVLIAEARRLMGIGPNRLPIP